MGSISDSVKLETLRRLARDSAPAALGNAKWLVGEAKVHTRFCSANQDSPGKYKFNINPNTLTADYELWICGDPDWFYLAPVSVMRQMYEAPAAYVDRRHPKIRVVSLDTLGHRATFARGGQSLNMAPYFQASL